MNWLDIVLLVILAGFAFQGMKTGLLGTAVTAIGVFIGWMLAGRLSDKIGAIFDFTPFSDTIVTVLSYAVIMILTMVAVRFVWKFVRPVLTLATLGLSGMVDKFGGLALGLIVGFVICIAVIIAMARLSYNFELPDEGLAGSVASRVPKVQDTKESVENALVESGVVPPLVKILAALPGDTLGFVPSDFKLSLEILKQNIDV